MNDPKRNRSFRKSLFVIITAVSILMVGMVALQPHVLASVDLPPISLTVVGPDGTQVVLNETDVGNLASYRAYGGRRTSLPALQGLGNYTGVPLTMFCDLVGGIHSGYDVAIIASGFSKTLTYEMLNGTGLNTYDNVTGNPVQHNQTLTPMLAYYYNDVNVSSSEGPLRLAIVGSEGLCTDSSLWVKQVTTLEILPDPQLTLVALNGTQLTLNWTSVGNLPTLRGVGAYRTSFPSIKGLGNYTGVSLNTLCDLVGGMNSSVALRLTAIDGYVKTFSYDQVNGAFQAYDPITGQPVQNNQSLTPILAYQFNDANLTVDSGPLRLAIIGPEGLATPSTYWVKMVLKMEIRYIDDVAPTAVNPFKAVVGQNYTCTFNVTVQNLGGYFENFTLTLYANSSVAATLNLILENGTATTVSPVWNTTGFTYGNYTIKATTSTVQDETNTTNNTFTSTVKVHVGMPGDVSSTTPGTYDGTVNMKDIAYMVALFNTRPTSPNWNPNADVNNDLVVNMKDIAIAIVNFNHHE